MAASGVRSRRATDLADDLSVPAGLLDGSTTSLRGLGCTDSAECESVESESGEGTEGAGRGRESAEVETSDRGRGHRLSGGTTDRSAAEDTTECAEAEANRRVAGHGGRGGDARGLGLLSGHRGGCGCAGRLGVGTSESD